MIKDSGARRAFESGAVRDIADSKGRCDLLPLDIISDFLIDGKDDVMACLGNFMNTHIQLELYSAVMEFCKIRGWGIPEMLLEVSIHYEEGAKKYSDRNWEKGIPTHCFLDSGVRHYLKWLRGDKDEPHDRAFVWNMLGLIWTMEHHPELDDIPTWNNGLSKWNTEPTTTNA